MTKDQLEKIIMVCLEDLRSQATSGAEVELIISFVESLRKRVHDADQSDQFVKILQKKLNEMQS